MARGLGAHQVSLLLPDVPAMEGNLQVLIAYRASLSAGVAALTGPHTAGSGLLGLLRHFQQFPRKDFQSLHYTLHKNCVHLNMLAPIEAYMHSHSLATDTVRKVFLQTSSACPRGGWEANDISKPCNHYYRLRSGT